MKQADPVIGFDAYRVTEAIDTSTWRLQAEAGPDLEMRIDDRHRVAFEALRWEFRGPARSHFRDGAGLVQRRVEIFSATPILENLPDETGDRGCRILRAVQAMIPTRIEWTRGSEAEAAEAIEAVSALIGHPLLLSPSAGDYREKAELDTCHDDEPKVAAFDDIAAYFRPASRSCSWDLRTDTFQGHGSPDASSKLFGCFKESLTAHERLQASEAVAAFYAKAAPVLGISDDEVTKRIAEIMECGEVR